MPPMTYPPLMEKEIERNRTKPSWQVPRGKFWIICKSLNPDSNEGVEERVSKEDGPQREDLEFDNWAAADGWIDEQVKRGPGCEGLQYVSFHIFDQNGDCSNNPPSE